MWVLRFWCTQRMERHYARAAAACRQAVREALDIIAPIECCGCGAEGSLLCDDCLAMFFGPMRHANAGGPGDLGFSTWAAAEYSGVVRPVVLALKNGSLDKQLFRPIIEELVDRWVEIENERVTRDIAVLAAPSGIMRRIRGNLVVEDLADWAGAALNAAGWHADYRPRAFRRDPMRRSPVHLAGLGVHARAQARHATLRAGERTDTAVLLVDDVVTSGATLGACARAVTQAGGQVIAALTLAETPRSSTRLSTSFRVL